MYYFKKLSLVTIIMSLAITTFAQERKHEHKEHLSEMLKHYISTKDALTEDDFEDAQSHLSEFKNEVLNNNEMNNHEEHSEMHAKHHNSMLEALNDADQTDNLKELRLAFQAITTNLVKALENQGHSGKTLYLQYCPMAANKEGAYWISGQKKINNPYMGKKMPSCGKTEKELNSDN